MLGNYPRSKYYVVVLGEIRAQITPVPSHRVKHTHIGAVRAYNPYIIQIIETAFRGKRWKFFNLLFPICNIIPSSNSPVSISNSM